MIAWCMFTKVNYNLNLLLRSSPNDIGVGERRVVRKSIPIQLLFKNTLNSFKNPLEFLAFVYHKNLYQKLELVPGNIFV